MGIYTEGVSTTEFWRGKVRNLLPKSKIPILKYTWVCHNLKCLKFYNITARFARKKGESGSFFGLCPKNEPQSLTYLTVLPFAHAKNKRWFVFRALPEKRTIISSHARAKRARA
ncbi:MAG: hypothetical protein U5L45_01390 [Saprospiraceae bacterium]|nr:hypothetical protein [Saprospiraceae bacterium]